ncbi:hypothetical protein Droror1_Dr00011342 [Drosera rotundifolia]
MAVQEYPPPHFSVAPMMNWTTNHYRTVARLISKHAWLYTEMIAVETIVYQEGNLLRMSWPQGSRTYGCFGVRLMLDPKFVGEAMLVIAANTGVRVTVKCRIGVGDRDSYNELCTSTIMAFYMTFQILSLP